jgi:hypothetical protein
MSTKLVPCFWSQKDGEELTAFHAKMRRIFDRTDLEEIKKCLVVYADTMELIYARMPEMPAAVKKDWATANAMSPDWFSDALSNRLQNAMLVSALLLTVTAGMFYDPPTDNNQSMDFRCLVYLTGACNMFFILSIMMGIFFIENAMSRAYGNSERFYLIMKYYIYKDLSQVFMAIGSALFPILLSIPTWQKYMQVDANILMAITVLYIIVIILVMAKTTMSAAREQARRGKMVDTIVDPATSRLLPGFFPDNEDMQPEDFAAMYQVPVVYFMK